MTDDHRDRSSDAELVDACNAGSADEAAAAFEALYKRHRGYVQRVALRFTRDRELAADALQETFTYLLRQFPPAGRGLMLTARLTTFLYPIAKNFAISSVRKAGRFEPSGEDPDALPQADAPEAGADTIDRVLAALSPERSEVLVLRFVDGMTLVEVAEALGIPVGTVKSRLHLALKQLRDDPALKNLFEP